MLTISNLSFYFGGRPIFDGANLQIKPKDKIGLIGLNGMGKSTLLRLIVGEYQADAGSISKAGDCSIGFLIPRISFIDSFIKIILPSSSNN